MDFLSRPGQEELLERVVLERSVREHEEMDELRIAKFDYPVYIDFEWNTILEKTTYSQRTETLRTGMIILEKYGYFPQCLKNGRMPLLRTWPHRADLLYQRLTKTAGQSGFR